MQAAITVVGGGRLPTRKQRADPSLDILTAGLVERAAGRRRQVRGEATHSFEVGLDGPGRLLPPAGTARTSGQGRLR